MVTDGKDGWPHASSSTTFSSAFPAPSRRSTRHHPKAK
jgi:hypothetical protein